MPARGTGAATLRAPLKLCEALFQRAFRPAPRTRRQGLAVLPPRGDRAPWPCSVKVPWLAIAKVLSSVSRRTNATLLTPAAVVAFPLIWCLLVSGHSSASSALCLLDRSTEPVEPSLPVLCRPWHRVRGHQTHNILVLRAASTVVVRPSLKGLAVVLVGTQLKLLLAAVLPADSSQTRHRL